MRRQYRERMQNMKASEILRHTFYGSLRDYVNLTELDTDSEKLFKHPPLSYLVALDASELDLTDKDLINMAEGRALKNLQWLSLTHNPRITEVGVRALCKAIKEGHLDPDWIDLKKTAYCATPYLDDDVDYAGKMNPCTWRIGKNGYDLMEEFGHQRWMSFGRPIERMDTEQIDSAIYPRNRFPYTEFEPYSSAMELKTISLPFPLGEYLRLLRPGKRYLDNDLFLELLAKIVRARGDAPERLEKILKEIESKSSIDP